MIFKAACSQKVNILLCIMLAGSSQANPFVVRHLLPIVVLPYQILILRSLQLFLL